MILQDKKPDDDCRCEVCENAEKLLDATKNYLKKNEKNEIAKALQQQKQQQKFWSQVSALSKIKTVCLVNVINAQL